MLSWQLLNTDTDQLQKRNPETMNYCSMEDECIVSRRCMITDDVRYILQIKNTMWKANDADGPREVNSEKKSLVPLWLVPDLPLCLGVRTGPRWPGDPSSCQKYFFTMDFCLCGAILKLKEFCFGTIPEIMIELTACVGLPGLPPSGPK